MPIKRTGKLICCYCKKEFGWVDFELIRNNINSSTFVVETIPNEPRIKKTIMPDGRIIARVFCPYCNQDNIFEFEENGQ